MPEIQVHNLSTILSRVRPVPMSSINRRRLPLNSARPVLRPPISVLISALSSAMSALAAKCSQAASSRLKTFFRRGWGRVVHAVRSFPGGKVIHFPPFVTISLQIQPTLPNFTPFNFSRQITGLNWPLSVIFQTGLPPYCSTFPFVLYSGSGRENTRPWRPGLERAISSGG